jgi:23S rRNA pseudouridine1911/1915/1917 synthase
MTKKPAAVRFEVEGLDGEARLDKVLKTRFPQWGRQAVGRLISNRGVEVNGRVVWLASWKVRNGDRISIANPPKGKPRGPENFPDAWIVAEEEDLIVVNKPAGLRSQATRAGGKDNLLSLAETRFGEVRLFHRLDRDTSGLCLLTRPGPVNAYLDAVYKQRLVEKEYLSVVASLGRLEDEGVISVALTRHSRRSDMMQVAEGDRKRSAQWAETRYRVEGPLEGGFLVRLWPVTGRTHQLRVHLASMGAPIIGDRLYGGAEAKRLMLHAYRLVLPEVGEFPRRVYQVEAEDLLQP